MKFRDMSLLAAFALVLPLIANAEGLQGQLDQAEIDEVEQRIQQFYKDPNDPAGINQVPKKYSPEKKQFVQSQQKLKLKPGQQVPKVQGTAQQLIQQAQVKATDQFQQHQCETFIDKKFPKLGCKNPEGKATAEANDSVEDLTDSWIAASDVIYDLDSVKTSGRTKLKLWSDDYWKIRYGITSYRYAEGKDFSSYHKAVEDYAQPKEWKALVGSVGIDKIASTIVDWSPSEKYDITVGDAAFNLTRGQKEEGAGLLNDKNDVEEWMGICHGWAPAAFMVPKADKSVNVIGTGNAKVTWYPHDIRSMASLAWANGDTDTNFVGGRCDVKKVSTHPNGRIKQQECFDNNPATFHLALANLIGEKKLSFVMDKTFDYEVWNQPVQSYEFTYFNPLNPSEKSKKWEDVAVDYDRAFKAKDRFQKPLSRGKNGSDRSVKKIVGVVASVTYLVEVSPKQGTANENAVERVTYTYDLELHEKGGAYVALGGEWHSNVHPDFLWMPTKTTVASTDYDSVAVTYTGKKPTDKLTKTAAQASKAEGYPLCKVLSHLVEESSGEKYSCH